MSKPAYSFQDDPDAFVRAYQSLADNPAFVDLMAFIAYERDQALQTSVTSADDELTRKARGLYAKLAEIVGETPPVGTDTRTWLEKHLEMARRSIVERGKPKATQVKRLPQEL